MNNMDPKKLTSWSTFAGVLGIVLYVVAFVLLWKGGGSLFFDRVDQKDLYFAGSGFLYIAIWLKLGAICRKEQ